MYWTSAGNSGQIITTKCVWQFPVVIIGCQEMIQGKGISLVQYQNYGYLYSVDAA